MRIEPITSTLARSRSNHWPTPALVGRGGIEPHARKGLRLQRSGSTSLPLLTLPICLVAAIRIERTTFSL